MVLDGFGMKRRGVILHGALSPVDVCALHSTRAVVSKARSVVSTNKEGPLIATFELTR